VENGVKRSIPTWDTFIAMNLSPGGIINLQREEYDNIPSGPPMPVINT
jgi:hypothetical protein